MGQSQVKYFDFDETCTDGNSIPKNHTIRVLSSWSRFFDFIRIFENRRPRKFEKKKFEKSQLKSFWIFFIDWDDCNFLKSLFANQSLFPILKTGSFAHTYNVHKNVIYTRKTNFSNWNFGQALLTGIRVVWNGYKRFFDLSLRERFFSHICMWRMYWRMYLHTKL